MILLLLVLCNFIKVDTTFYTDGTSWTMQKIDTVNYLDLDYKYNEGIDMLSIDSSFYPDSSLVERYKCHQNLKELERLRKQVERKAKIQKIINKIPIVLLILDIAYITTLETIQTFSRK